ncbi:Pre-mRNA-splicing factor SYF1 [Clydaea vesicula]|uniref:Pre-mRNA-splicing factor SYF1 n=1 Tax=Clydaea vesicula TaxID=447962 RepID=A0AAD5XXY1_9FUNG|nr:Pre-mRNA-splicing factor SYF1 [Clydaea vesicula]
MVKLGKKKEEKKDSDKNQETEKKKEFELHNTQHDENHFSITEVDQKFEKHKQNANFQSKVFLYERAVLELPGSYKLWKQYLDLRVAAVLDGPEDPETGLKKRLLHPWDPHWELVNNCFERSLMLCNKFPVIWLMYCKFLMHQCRPTQTRRVFDKALMSLPITQNQRVWDLYLKFASQVGGLTAIKVWKRYLKLEPEQTESYVAVLLEIDPPRYAEAARCLSELIETPAFKPKKSKSTYELWTQLCDLIIAHPDEMDVVSETVSTPIDEKLGVVSKLDIDKVLRCGISKFSDQVGRLWTALANYWVFKLEVEKARDVYEEGISKVTTVQDFTIVFDAYAKYAEFELSQKMENLDKIREEGDEEEIQNFEIDLEMEMSKFERLIKRRPFLVNDVLLRQNPHNVHHWEKRVELYLKLDEQQKAIDTYVQAVGTINPKRVDGKLHMLWVHFAQYYENLGDLKSARQVFEKAIVVQFRKVDELAEIWCQWAEMELRHEEFDLALEVMGRATTIPSGKYVSQINFNDETLTPQRRLFKSLKLWSFYVDLEESIGTVESTKVIYDKILELKIANAQIIMNYASFLEEQNWFEESYKVYERGIELFGYPVAFDIWTLYLNKFLQRYGGTKLERTRELFESAIDKVPPKYAKPFYLMYAKLEEEHGLARHSMRIYDRAAAACSDEDRYDVYLIYISKATQFFGLTSTREIYEKAIESLPDRKAKEICLKYSELELSLGEVDRARAVFAYGSQFSDPRSDLSYWKQWHNFEIKHGNDDTFKEMLRIRRSVQAKFNSEVSYISAQLLASTGQSTVALTTIPSDAMESLEAEIKEGEQSTRVMGFVRATDTEPKVEHGEGNNPDEIDIQESDEGESEEGEDVSVGNKNEKIEKRDIPLAVFGGLASKVDEEKKEEKKMGAKDRIAKRKREANDE